MLTKEECSTSLAVLYAMAQITVRKREKLKFSIKNDFDVLTKLINEHFKLVKENERLSTQLVEYQRVCQVKQVRINELEKSLDKACEKLALICEEINICKIEYCPLEHPKFGCSKCDNARCWKEWLLKEVQEDVD